MVRSLRRPAVKGTKIPGSPKYVQVPIRKDTSGFPKVNFSVPDTSYWRVDQRNNKPNAIITITPDGIELGWDTCGSCSMTFYNCKCSAGVSLPNSIGHMYTMRGGTKPLPPPPLAVTFEPPRRSLRTQDKPLVPVKPKRSLRRKKQEEVLAKEADAIVRKLTRRLKRR